MTTIARLTRGKQMRHRAAPGRSLPAPAVHDHHPAASGQQAVHPATEQAPMIITTSGLAKSHGHIQSLNGIDLAVPEHSIFGFLGPNGAGKTTTIKLLLGLARPTSGTATVFGLDTTGHSRAIRRRVGYLAQDPRFYDKMTARQTLRFSASFFYTGPGHAIEQRVAEALELVGLAGSADRPVKGFSGGERQRLGIAQAQINHPDLLILDEPAASLDPMGRRDVLAVMERLRQHTTIFYSTHILDDVQRVSDTVAILNQGTLVAQAPIDELLGTRGGGTTYRAALRGDLTDLRVRLEDQPWVSSLSVTSSHASLDLQVTVRDEAAAERHLLPLLTADPGVTVLEFGRTRHNLEDVFVQLVKGAGHGR
jgi:ABC-2 type transport system ATP-binding protein